MAKEALVGNDTTTLVRGGRSGMALFDDRSFEQRTDTTLRDFWLTHLNETYYRTRTFDPKTFDFTHGVGDIDLDAF